MPVVPIVTTYDPKGFARAQKDFAKVSKGLSGFATAAKTAVLGATGLGLAAAGVGIKLATMAEEANKSDLRIAQINKSMGLFGKETEKVTNRLIKSAEAQAMATGVDDDAIKAVQAKLLTFKELAKSADTVGGAFDRAQKAAVDLEKAGFGPADKAAIQLGKALNDPLKGMTALSRSGITFTKVEKEKIATLMKSGKIHEAQNLILKAVEKQVGGVAEATASSSDKMKVAWENVQESVGGLLLPAFQKVTDFVTKQIVPAINSFVDKVKGGASPIQALSDVIREKFGKDVADKFDMAREVVGKLVEAFKSAVSWVSENRAWLEPLVVGILAMVAAFKIWQGVMAIVTVAQAALNLVMAANPIGLVVLAIVGLVGALVYAWKNSETLRTNVTKAWDAIKTASVTVFTAIKDFIGKVWEGIKNAAEKAWDAIKTAAGIAWNLIKAAALGPVGLLVVYIIKHWDDIKEKTKAAWERVKEVTSAAWDRIKEAVTTAAGKVVTWMKSFPGKIVEGLGNLGRLLWDAGTDVVMGLWNGIKSMTGWIVNKVTGWVKSVLPDPVKKALHINSPSKLFYEIGQGVGEGLANGVTAAGAVVTSAATGLKDKLVGVFKGLNLTDTFGGIFGTVGEAGDVTGAGLLASLEQQGETIRNWKANLTKLATMGFSQSAISAIAAAGPSAWANVAALTSITPDQVVSYNNAWSGVESENTDSSLNNFAQTIVLNIDLGDATRTVTQDIVTTAVVDGTYETRLGLT